MKISINRIKKYICNYRKARKKSERSCWTQWVWKWTMGIEGLWIPSRWPEKALWWKVLNLHQSIWCWINSSLTTCLIFFGGVRRTFHKLFVGHQNVFAKRSKKSCCHDRCYTLSPRRASFQIKKAQIRGPSFPKGWSVLKWIGFWKKPPLES